MKPLPKLSDGATYFTDDNGQRVCTGSRMGRRNTLPDNRTGAFKLRLVRLRWVGDYDEGGAYWGNTRGTWIYRATNTADASGGYNTQGAPGCLIEIFVRATSRAEAKAKVREELPKARFWN